MNPKQKQLSLNRAASKEQFPISDRFMLKIAVFILFCITFTLRAQVFPDRITLEPAAIFYPPSPPPAGAVGYEMVTYRSPSGNQPPYHVDMLYSVNGTNLVWYNMTVDVSGGVEWYSMGYGAELSPATQPMLTSIPFDQSVRLAVTPTPFYIGIAFGNYNFGWAELVNDTSGLHLINSAFSYNNSGLFIGTLEAVPEPSLLSLLALGAASLTALRCRPFRNEPRCVKKSANS